MRSIKRKRIKSSHSDRMFNLVNSLLLILIFIVILIPLVYILSCSFSDYKALYGGKVTLYPIGFTLDSYKVVFQLKEVWVGYRNSLIYAVLGTAINVVMTILVAYPLSRKDLNGRRVISFLFMFTMLFSGGLIPTYMVIKSLGMVNTIWAMVIPGAVSIWNVIITRTFFQTSIPSELLEAAKIDGCSDFKFIRSIVLPLSTTIIAVNILFYAVGHWNAYTSALIYLNDVNMHPLQLVLRKVLLQNSIDNASMANAATMAQKSASSLATAKLEQLRETMKYSIIVVASAPVLILYPFVQKYFVKGVMIGSIKG